MSLLLNLLLLVVAGLALIAGLLIGTLFDLNSLFSGPDVDVAEKMLALDHEPFVRPYNGSEAVLPTIGIHSHDDIISKRVSLIDYIWKDAGGDLPKSMPMNVTKSIEMDGRFKTLRNVAGSIDRLEIAMDYGVTSDVFLFHPLQDNGSRQLVIFHSGHEGGFTVHLRELRFFLERGYNVLAFSMPLHGGNNQPIVLSEEFGTIRLTSHDTFKLIESKAFSPIKYFVEPITLSLNYVEEEYGYNSTVMMGISGGGWTTVLYAAIDPRVSASYPVAGIMPFHLYQEDEPIGDYEQSHAELSSIANQFELFILGSYGENRSQLLIFNEGDPCCFSGDRHQAYLPVIEESMKELGAGRFDMYIDDSNRHAVSNDALEKILQDIRLV